MWIWCPSLDRTEFDQGRMHLLDRTRDRVMSCADRSGLPNVLICGRTATFKQTQLPSSYIRVLRFDFPRAEGGRDSMIGFSGMWTLRFRVARDGLVMDHTLHPVFVPSHPYVHCSLGANPIAVTNKPSICSGFSGCWREATM